MLRPISPHKERGRDLQKHNSLEKTKGIHRLSQRRLHTFIFFGVTRSSLLIQVVCFANSEFGQPVRKETRLEATALRDEPLGLPVIVAAAGGRALPLGWCPPAPAPCSTGSVVQAARHRQPAGWTRPQRAFSRHQASADRNA